MNSPILQATRGYSVAGTAVLKIFLIPRCVFKLGFCFCRGDSYDLSTHSVAFIHAKNNDKTKTINSKSENQQEDDPDS